MRVEEDFAIEIGDEEATLISTPDELCALIERRLAVAGAEKWSFCPTSRAFYQVRRELMQLGVERVSIKPNSRLHTLLPRKNRDVLWCQLNSALPVELAPLGRAAFVEQLCACWWFGSLLSLFLLPFFPMPVLEFVVGGGASLLLLHMATVSLRVFPHSTVRLVGDLARRVAWTIPVQNGGLQTRDVWPQLRLIIADELSVAPEKVTRDADLVRDLGLD